MDETADVVQQILGYGRRLEKYIERGNEEFKVQYLLVFKIAVKWEMRQLLRLCKRVRRTYVVFLYERPR